MQLAMLDHLFLALGLVFALPIVFFFTPTFGELAAAVPRWLGRPPHIWDDDARLLWVELDDQGLLFAFVYDGEERVFQPTGHRRKHWVRRWERDCGVVWEQRAALAPADAVVVAAGQVVLPTPHGTLRAIDPVSGATRWQVELPLERLRPALVLGERVLYGGRRRGAPADDWMCFDATTGARLHEGRGSLEQAEQRLFDEPEGPEPDREDIEAWRRRLGSERRVRQRLFPEAIERDDWLADRRCELIRAPRTGGAGWELLLRLRGDADGFRHPLGPASEGSALRFVRELRPRCYAVQATGVLRTPHGKQCVTLVVDAARGRVLAELSRAGSRVLSPRGRFEAVAV